MRILIFLTYTSILVEGFHKKLMLHSLLHHALFCVHHSLEMEFRLSPLTIRLKHAQHQHSCKCWFDICMMFTDKPMIVLFWYLVLSKPLISSFSPGSFAMGDEEEKKSKKGGRRTSVFAKFGSVRKTTKVLFKLSTAVDTYGEFPVILFWSSCRRTNRTEILREQLTTLSLYQLLMLNAFTVTGKSTTGRQYNVQVSCLLCHLLLLTCCHSMRLWAWLDI